MKPIRTPSQTFLPLPGAGSCGGSTAVACGRLITCVASSPGGISGVASTSCPSRARSRSARNSSAVW